MLGVPNLSGKPRTGYRLFIIRVKPVILSISIFFIPRIVPIEFVIDIPLEVYSMLTTSVKPFAERSQVEIPRAAHK
jgi:hypothetical protein